MNLILQVFYSVFSGLILGYALPNEQLKFGCPWLVLIALIPFYLAIKKSKNYKRAFLSGFIQGGTTHLYSSFWLANFKDFAALTLGASAIGTAIILGVISIYLYLPFSSNKDKRPLAANTILYKWTESKTFQIFYFAGMYTVYEWCKSCSFLGYPWATLSSTIYNWNILMQLASFTGTYGITFILVLINLLIFEAASLIWNYKKVSTNTIFDLKISATLTGILLCLALIHGAYWELKPIKPQKLLTTIVVQQNCDPWIPRLEDDAIKASQELTESALAELDYEENKKAQLIVWSEGTLAYKFPEAEKFYQRNPFERPLIKFIDKIDIPLLTGGAYTKNKQLRIYNNSALLFDKDGNFRGAYGKNHLVPLAESIPGMEYPAIKKFMAKVIGISNGWTPGDQYTLFKLNCSWAPSRKLPASDTIDITIPHWQQKQNESQQPTVTIAAPICYDDAFPDIMGPLFLNGAELFINLTNDSWSLKKSSEYQHFVVASYRSIEYRTTMVRSTNSGYSVVLNPKGQILKDAPLFEEHAFWYDVPIYDHKMTFYARFGNWLPWSLFILFIGTCIYFYLSRKKV